MTRPDKPALSRRALLGGTAAAGVGVVLASGGDAVADAAGHAPVDQGAVDAVAARLDADLVALRRQLHADPEAAGEERHTAAAVAGRLRAAGLEVTEGVGGTGVVAVLRGARRGRTVAYRADMDAVPVNGVVGGNAKPVHACGHDVHTTVGVGVAEVLARLRHRLSGTVVFLFQPGEESLKGAAAMLATGVLERNGVAEVHALHCGPYPVGRFAVTPGSGLPGQDWATVTVAGPDAVGTAARLRAELAGLATVAFPEGAADLERMVTDVQTPDGPLARFVVVRAGAQAPDAEGRVRIDLTYRCWPQERTAEIREAVRRTVQGYPGATVVFPRDPFPALVCPEDDARVLARHLRRRLGPDAVTVNHAAYPFNGEDYALFLQRVPGTYTFLGVRGPGAVITEAYPHYPDFTPDERAIGVGVRAMAGWLAVRARG